jgi:hypothetical protein
MIDKDMIEMDVKLKFDIRMTSCEYKNGRHFLYFHMTDLCTSPHLDELTDYLKDMGKETNVAYAGWFEGHFEYIYE